MDVINDTTKDTKSEEEKNQVKRHRKQYFYLYFTDSPETDEFIRLYKLLLNPAVRKYKGYDVAKKLYGDDFKSNLNFCNITHENNVSLNNFISKLRTILLRHKNVDLSTYEFDFIKRKQYFIEYFIDSNAKEEEKKLLEEKLIKISTMSSIKKIKGYDSIVKLYGPSFNEKLKNIEISDSADCCNFRRTVLKELNKPEIVDIKPMKEYFINYFVDSSDNLENRDVLQKKINAALKDSKTFKYTGLSVAFKLYGNSLDEHLKENIDLPKNWKRSFECFVDYLSKFLLSYEERNIKEKEIVSKSRKKEYFIDYFIDPNASLTEKENLQKKISIIISTPKFRRLKGYYICTKIYGQQLNEKAADITLSNDDNNSFNSLRISLKNLLAKFDLKEEIKEKTKDEFEGYSYIDRMIIKLYGSFDEEEIKKILFIDDDILINSLINCLDKLDKNKVFSFIILKHPNHIKDLLSSSYFKYLTDSASELEMEVIYLKLLSITNLNITSDFISSITGVSKSEIDNYEIMSIDDNMNEFNSYLNSKKISEKIKEYKKK